MLTVVFIPFIQLILSYHVAADTFDLKLFKRERRRKNKCVFYKIGRETKCEEVTLLVQNYNDTYEVSFGANNQLVSAVRTPAYVEKRCKNENRKCCGPILTRCKTHGIYKKFATLKRNGKGELKMTDGKIERKHVGKYCECK